MTATTDAATASGRDWRHERALAESLLPVMSLARDVFGCRTVAEVLRSPRLADILCVAGTLDDLGVLALDDVPSSSRLVESFANAIRRVVDEQGADSVEVYMRCDVEKSATPKAIVKEKGSSDYTVRSIRKRITDDLERHAGAHATLLAARTLTDLPPIVASTRVDGRLDDALSALGAVAGAHDVVAKIARHLVVSRLGLVTRKSYSMTHQTAALLSELRHLVKSRADDVGLVDLDKIVRRKAPSLLPCRDELVELLKLARVGEHLALRASDSVRLKAAIVELGRPATKAEISRVSGVSETRLTDRLSNVRSVVRTGKSTWGFADWVDVTYDNVPAIVEQRIREHDGAAPVSLLVEELPERFGISTASVVNCLAEPWIEIVDGKARLVDGELADVEPAVVESNDAEPADVEPAVVDSADVEPADIEPAPEATAQHEEPAHPAEPAAPERSWWAKFRRRRDKSSGAT